MAKKERNKKSHFHFFMDARSSSIETHSSDAKYDLYYLTRVKRRYFPTFTKRH